MAEHVAFLGGWGNVGQSASQKATFKASDTFDVTVSLNPAEGTGAAEINGTSFTFSLPADLKSIEYIGFYAKATSTEFTPIVVE